MCENFCSSWDPCDIISSAGVKRKRTACAGIGGLSPVRREDMRTQNMNVYFDESYWGCLRESAGKRPGREIRLGTGFTWKGRRWQIPAVYVCEEGLVADFCGRIEPEEIRAFYEKWSAGEEEAQSGEEREISGRDNPFCHAFRAEAYANEERMQTQMGCGAGWCPPALRPEEEAVSCEADQAEELLIRTYGLDPESGWSFWRSSFAWRENAPKSLRTLEFTLTEDPLLIPGPHFRAEQGAAGQKVEFVHPATNRTCVLTVLGQEAQSLDAGELFQKLEIESFPAHFQALHYQTEPELPDGELTVSDCVQSDQPVHREQTAAGSVAVIGGADGPTSFFVAGKLPDTGTHPKRRTAYSALHYEPEKTVEWKLTFQLRQDTKKEIRVEL